MKKICLTILIGVSLLFIGCGNNGDTIKNLTKKIDEANGYHIEGLLEIVNNENTYKYDIDVAYKKKDKFRVSLKNKANDHEQIILKNDSGVYVLTPSLNKSFKFQSEWPYNNSQSYLLQNIVEDINNDNKKTITKKDGYEIISTTVNYPNNKELTHQKIYLKNGVIKKVEVLNDKDIVKIKMTYNNISLKDKYKDDYFDLDNNMETDKTTIAPTTIDDAIYPMYMPKNTYLSNEEKVSFENGERIILTFSGEEPFTLIEQTTNTTPTMEQVDGEVELLNDVFGYINDDIASWVSNGVEYYAVNESMDQDELVKVINSISVIPVGK